MARKKKPAKDRKASRRKIHKLSPRQQLVVCSLLGTGYSLQVIQDVLQDEHGIKISRQGIQVYRKSLKWLKIIRWMAKRQQKKAMQHPIAQKINRLNVLNRAINIALDTGSAPVSSLIREARIETEGERALVEVKDSALHIYLPEQKEE